MNFGKQSSENLQSQYVYDKYQEKLEVVKKGIELDALHTGSLESRRQFAAVFFDVSASGKQLAEHTGKLVIVPDLNVDSQGNSCIVLKDYQPHKSVKTQSMSRGDEAAARFNLDDIQDDSIDLSIR